MKYFLIVSKSPIDLSEKVNKHLEGGWDLRGEAIVTTIVEIGQYGKEHEVPICAQAVIKEGG